jgi:hypothetical protein
MGPPGHFAIALAAKSFAPEVPLWVLLLGTEVSDLLSYGFEFIGIEKFGTSHTGIHQKEIHFTLNTTSHSIHFLLLSILLAITAYSTMLVPVIAIKYGYNTVFVAGSVVGFLILLAASAFLWVYGKRMCQMGSSLIVNDAIILGIILGILWIVEISINNFLAPPLPARDIVDNIFWAMIAFSIFVFATVCAYRAESIRVGIVVAIWSGLVSGVLACGMALSLIVFGMRFITQDPLNIAEWAARGTDTNAPTMAAYFAYETFAGAFMHLIVLGIFMGLLLGLLGGTVGRVIKETIRWIQR